MKEKLVLVLISIAACICLPGSLGCGEPAPAERAVESAGTSLPPPSTDERAWDSAEISLPPPSTDGQMSVEQALAKRRSVRHFVRKDLNLQQIGQLAWAAQGITKRDTGFRTAPSAGATYPLELYLLTKNGVFHYQPEGHKLLRVSQEDSRSALARAALGQSSVSNAPLDFVITGIYARTSRRYGDRAERYVILEAGHVAQNIHLQAVALGLGSVPVGAYSDDQVANLLNLPDGEIPLYIIPVGHPSG